MRKLTQFADRSEAHRLADYLYAEGISTQVDSERDGSWAVWVRDDEQTDDARTHLQRFHDGLDAGELARAAAQAQSRRQQQKLKERQAQANRIALKARWSNEGFMSRGVTPVTAAFMVASIGVALLSHLGSKYEPIRGLFITQHVIERGPDGRDYRVWERGLPEVRRGQVWRLVTPIFIHFGLLHIVFNMMWLKDLGGLIERKQRWPRLLGVILLTAATSNLAQYAWSGPAFGGMSGVVYGLLGYSWVRGKFDLNCGLFVDRRHVTWMGIWLVLCMTGAMGPIANTAHLVGLLAGMAWGFVTSGAPTRWWANVRAPRE